jgi:branched-chain amino acid transport system substrate-binding protein
MTTRRTILKSGALGAATLATTMMPWKKLRAQPKPVKVALIAPLSGPWAMGGAKIELVQIDAGDSAEKAKNAAQRLVAQEPDVIGGMGSWLSTFTLAVTEVTERAQIPWLTLSYADSITGRGFKYVYQSSMPAGLQPEASLPTIIALAKAATGKAPATAGIIGDNTASPVAFLKPMREGGLEKLGIKLLMNETFTPPLSDATPLMQKVRSTRPEFLVYVTTTISDVKLGLEKLNEFRLGKGAVPIIANGAHMGAPEVLKNVSADLIEGLMFIVANWGMKGHEEIEALFKKQSGEPWITQDGLAGYGHAWILKEGLEAAGVADKVKVNEAIKKLDLKTGRAADTFPGGVKFDENGRRVGAPVCIVQWQDGKPMTVFPTDRATAKARWPKTA